MSSSDGFCSSLSFAPFELGQPYTHPIPSAPQHERTLSSSNSTPLPTPAQTTSSLATKTNPVPPIKVSQSPTGVAPSHPSPTRSSSASSFTASLNQQSSNPVVNNPTPTLGTVPLVTATNSAPPPALPLTTPPQTPVSGVSHSAHSSISSSVVLGKRDIGATSESEKDEIKETARNGVEHLPKKRRIAPTLISTRSDMPPKKSEDAAK